MYQVDASDVIGVWLSRFKQRSS